MAEVVESTPEATLGVTPPAASVPDVQKPAESAPAAPETPETPKQEATDEQPAKQSSKRFERRLDRAYRRAAEAEARAKLFEEQLAKLKPPPAPGDPGAPRLEQFDDIEKFAAAREKYAAEKAVKQYEAKQRQQSAQQAQAQLTSAWEERSEKGLDKYDDFADVVGELKPTNPVTAAIMQADNGEDIAYHLGKNPKEAMRIAGLQPMQQIMAIGYLGAKLASEPPKAKQPSKAPPPPTPVSGARPVPSETHDPNDDMKTFIKKRNRELGRVALK
jgi:hypothetical protein